MTKAPPQKLGALSSHQALEYAREVVTHEARALKELEGRIGDAVLATVALLLACEGRVVVTGMGKPGLIGQKISATLASTGTPSYALHPAEALHGDLGRVHESDVTLVLSNSGETEEIVRLLPHLRGTGARIVAITGKPESTLGQHADVVIDIGDLDEACPLGMAPSTSTTAMLCIGDVLALTVQKCRAFTPEAYARFHPGGSLGRKLLKVDEIMRTSDQSPVIQSGRSIKEALFAITKARSGAISITDDEGRLLGIFTDGDLRRHMAQGTSIDRSVGEVMTRGPRTILPDRFATEAARIMREHKIDELPVVDQDGRPLGMIDVQDLLAVGLGA
ncbi:MAG: KpsF/GutQ family sugar-phosphate isomerase [Planctomycetota bacterium]|jgi:arabinose-5-phosphate isomerase